MSTALARRAGPHAPAVFDASELDNIVRTVQAAGAFAFDVETRGIIRRDAEVMEHVEREWDQKLSELVSTHPKVLERSRQAIEDKWSKEMALDPLRNEVFWISIACDNHSWAIPMGHPNGEVLVPEKVGDGSTTPPTGYRDILKNGNESMKKAKFFIPAVFTPPPAQLSQEQVFTALEPLFFNEDIRKVNQNIKFDAKSVAKYYGGNLPLGEYVDTQVLMHIVDENQKDWRPRDASAGFKSGFSLESIIWRVFGFNPYAREGKIGKTIVHEPFGKACRYSHYDVRYAWMVYKRLWEVINKHPGLYNALLKDIPVMRVTAQMEMNGIEVDRRMLVKLGKELDLDINRSLSEIGQYVWPGFNPDSTVDMRILLFNKARKPKDFMGDYQTGLGLKPMKVSKKTGTPSVDKDTLREYKGKHEVIDHLLEYSSLKKLKGTYIDGAIPKMHNGRLHPQFHLHRTDTGRLSSSDPNLQNIPRDDRLRALYRAEAGHSLIVADYDQIELRIFGMYSQDPVLLDVFQNDKDIHAATAAVILGKPAEEVTKEERTVFGKVPNFLMGYGGGPHRLVEATEKMITLERAKEVIAQYNAGYAGMTTWKEKTLRQARKVGYVETMGGRRRRLPDLNASTSTKEGWAARSKAERQAINAIIQGTAAELCKDAMVDLGKHISDECKFLIQVHDELVVSVPTDQISQWKPVVEQSMGNGRIIQGVPLNVTAHAAGSWDQAKG